MFQVFKNGRKQFKGQTFETYEQARQAVRKAIRKKFGANKSAYRNTLAAVVTRGFTVAAWDAISRNPTNYTALGYTIRKVS